MSIKIPPDAQVIQDKRLDAIAIVNHLSSQLIEAKDVGLKARVKRALKEKGAIYAQSDLALAHLRPGSDVGPIDPRKLYRMIAAGGITEKQFLSAISVSKEKAGQFLTREEISAMSSTIEDPSPSLIVELTLDEAAMAGLSIADADRVVNLIAALPRIASVPAGNRAA